jgi:hypothetical protein
MVSQENIFGAIFGDLLKITFYMWQESQQKNAEIIHGQRNHKVAVKNKFLSFLQQTII